MSKKCGFIYKDARKLAGLTQEEALKYIPVCLRTLQAYESDNDKSIPDGFIVDKMIEAYGTPWLAYQHLWHSSELGKKYLPQLDITDLARSVLKFQKEVGDLKKINLDMIDIASDGVIEEHEEDRWRNVEKEISEVISASFAVLFSKKIMV